MSEDTLTVRVVFISGETAWGPEAVSATSAVSTLRDNVAATMAKPPCAIKFTKDESVIEFTALLGSLSAVGEVTLTVTVNSVLADASNIFGEFEQFYSEIHPTKAMSVVSPLEVERVSDTLRDIASMAGLTTLPAEVAAWTQVLLCAGKTFEDGDRFLFAPEEFINATREDGDGVGEGGGVAPGGLIYLSVGMSSGDDAYFYIVDAGGELAKLKGEEGVGAIYYARTWQDVFDDDDELSLKFWQKNISKDPRQPARVADGISAFFQQWICSKKLPIA